MTDKPPLLWHSNAPWASTGYGNQTALFAERLMEHYNLSISAFFGLEGNILPWKGIPVLPGIGSTHGNEVITDHVDTVFAADRRAGLVVTLMDVWVLDPAIWSQFDVASWVPVDHEPVPDPVRDFFLDSGAVPIAMSRFGETELRKAGLDPLYCPHGVDTKVYRPRDKQESREKTGFPQDAFVVGMVAANKGNPSRKCFQEAFQAFRLLNEKHPEARLYLHTEITGRFNGVDLLALANSIGIPASALNICDQYRTVHFPCTGEVMSEIYSSCDVLLSPSAGEGFGIPVVEAQACGVPVIASDFSAQKELCGAGWLVDGTRQYTPIGSWQFRPDVPDIFDALRQAYAASPEQRKQTSAKAREFALGYDADHVLTEYMLPALEEASERFAARKPTELKVAA